MIPTASGYHDPVLGIAFVVIIFIVFILAALFPEKKP